MEVPRHHQVEIQHLREVETVTLGVEKLQFVFTFENPGHFFRLAPLQAIGGIGDTAEYFGVNLRTVQDWEQGRRVPSGPSRNFLFVIDKEPEAVHRVLAQEHPDHP